MTLKKYQTGGSIKLNDGTVLDNLNTYIEDEVQYIDVGGVPLTLDQYKTLIEKGMYETNTERRAKLTEEEREQEDAKADAKEEERRYSDVKVDHGVTNVKLSNTADVQEFTPSSNVIWEDGEIVKLITDESGLMSKVKIGVYYHSDGTDGNRKGTKVQGRKPVKGTVPRKKQLAGLRQYQDGGLRRYQEAGIKKGFKLDPKIMDLTLNNPYGYPEGSRAFNRYQRYLDRPQATRNIQADYFNPTLSKSFQAGPEGFSLTGNYTPSLISAGEDQPWMWENDNRRGSFRVGPSLTSSLMMNNKIMQGRNTLGLNYAYQTPLNRSGSLVGGIEGEIGGLLRGFNRDAGGRTMTEFDAYGRPTLNERGLPITQSGYGQIQAGLGYYPQNSNFGIRGNVGYGDELSSMPGLSYGATANYGPTTFNIGKNRSGWGGGFGASFPLGMGTRKGSGDAYRRQTGGMYGPNTLSAAGQGVPSLGTTSTIVGQETDPALQAARIQSLGVAEQGLRTESGALSQKTREQEILDRTKAEEQAAQTATMYGRTTGAIEQGVGRGGELVGTTLFPEYSGGVPAALRAGQDAMQIQRAANLGAKGTKLIEGANVITDAAKASKAAELATEAGGWIGSAADTGKTIVVDAAGNTAKVGAAGIGAGLKEFATSGAGIGTIASGVGMGISALSNDKDPTRSNFGEYTGSILGSAGTGASVGSFFGPVGTIAGAVVGGGFGAITEGMGTKKARRAEAEYEAEATAQRNKGIYDLNERIGGLYGSHLSNISSGNLAQKTISGQNLGRNVMYQSGGASKKRQVILDQMNQGVNNQQFLKYDRQLRDIGLHTDETMDVPFSIAGQRFPAIPSADITPYGLKSNHPLAVQQKEAQTIDKMNQIRNFQKSQLTYKKGGVKQGMMMAMPRYGYNS